LQEWKNSHKICIRIALKSGEKESTIRNIKYKPTLLKAFKFAASFGGISQLGSTFSFLR